MALSRKFLSALGIEPEKVDEIIQAHAETVDALKEESAKYKTDAAKLKEVQTELDALKAKGDDGFKAKYEAEKAKYDKYVADVEAEKALTAKRAAFTEICKDAGLDDKGVAKAMKYTDWSKVEIGDDGKVKNAGDHVKALKEEWSEHVVTTQTQGASSATPPTGAGGTVDYNSMSDEDYYKAMEAKKGS